ncbi:MAG: hypothetical protein KME25_14205 [Symplocastrum torsivum CPER-KK1]|jgi:hypothetical protein|uniref:Uncharacterized protein n=1 Tax=Symplocastrum torsivum CPER-KK1 TaxID=450513 RepID=A0A951UBE6_9CYAN|nr:hypothetical protein [Symplocastrum torsivum CPER-KK1]
MPYSIQGLACLSILPFFEDLQVIPKKEGTLFPLRTTQSLSEDMLHKRYRHMRKITGVTQLIVKA